MERLSTAYTFARAREEGDRSRFVEIAVSLLFGGCVALSIAQCATASFALNRSGALEQVVVRAMPQKTQVAETPALPSHPVSRAVARPL